MYNKCNATTTKSIRRTKEGQDAELAPSAHYHLRFLPFFFFEGGCLPLSSMTAPPIAAAPSGSLCTALEAFSLATGPPGTLDTAGVAALPLPCISLCSPLVNASNRFRMMADRLLNLMH